MKTETKMQKKKKKKKKPQESQKRWHKTSIASTKEAKHVITQKEELNML